MINEVAGNFPLLALPIFQIVNELGESKRQSLGNNFKDVMDNQPGCWTNTGEVHVQILGTFHLITRIVRS